jgi:hypothetical protein
MTKSRLEVPHVKRNITKTIERKLKFGIQLVGETRPKMVMWTSIGKVQEFFLFTLIGASQFTMMFQQAYRRVCE